MKHSRLINHLKYILTTLAVINLILLFGFHYEIPSVIKNKFFREHTQEDSLYKKEDTKHPDSTQLKEVNLSFETKTLSYDGSNPLDLLSGVSVTDKKGNPLELSVYATIKATDDPSTKTITYTVKDEENHEAFAERKLILNNYYGPALSIGQPYPEIFDTDLNRILAIFTENSLLSANDGYGKNITDAIQCTYEVSDETARHVSVTFKVTNHFDDTASQTISLPISRTKPLIVLTENAVTLQKGQAFDSLSFVASATNEEGRDLTSRIKLEGTVDHNTPGTYKITYKLTDTDREQADPVTLTVTVKE